MVEDWRKKKEAGGLGFAVPRWKNIRNQLLAEAHSPHKVALGAAIGVWSVFFPILGTHMLMTAFLCWALRGSQLAGVAGCWVGNPWTYPLIWWASLKTGHWLMGVAGHPQEQLLLNTNVVDFWGKLEHLAGELFWPMLWGGELLGVGAFVLTYGIVWGYMAHSPQAAQVRRRQAR